MPLGLRPGVRLGRRCRSSRQPGKKLPSRSDETALALANNTEYGLVSYVYTRDLGTGLRVAERLDSGMVGLNRPVVSDPAAPFGGTKQSGLGREGGHEGMLEFTESKHVAVDW